MDRITSPHQMSREDIQLLVFQEVQMYRNEMKEEIRVLRERLDHLICNSIAQYVASAQMKSNIFPQTDTIERAPITKINKTKRPSKRKLLNSVIAEDSAKYVRQSEESDDIASAQMTHLKYSSHSMDSLNCIDQGRQLSSSKHFSQVDHSTDDTSSTSMPILSLPNLDAIQESNTLAIDNDNCNTSDEVSVEQVDFHNEDDYLTSGVGLMKEELDFDNSADMTFSDEMNNINNVHTSDEDFQISSHSNVKEKGELVGGKTSYDKKSNERTCIICAKVFKSSYWLIRHKVRAHHQDIPHKCRLCHREFYSVTCLRRHELGHTGEKPFGCKICGRTFTTMKSLKHHFASHAQGQTSST